MRTAITGGIGSGKSYVCQLLKEQGISVYDCDSHAKRLMAESADIRRELTRLIGPDAYLPAVSTAVPVAPAIPVAPAAPEAPAPSPPRYALNKPVVARFLMASAANAKALESIVHPAVAADFMASGMEWMESAILFESGFDRYVDRVVAVVAPMEVRIERVMKRDGITRQKALQWIERQMPQEELAKRADHVIVNDGQTPLPPQLAFCRQ